MSAFTAKSDNSCPCKDCQIRFVGCHSSCVAYIDWKQKREAKLAYKREQNKIRDALYTNSINLAKSVKQTGGIKYGRKSNDSRHR